MECKEKMTNPGLKVKNHRYLHALKDGLIFVAFIFAFFVSFLLVFMVIFLGGIQYVLASGARMSLISSHLFGVQVHFDEYKKDQHGIYSDIQIKGLSVSKNLIGSHESVVIFSAKKIELSWDVYHTVMSFRPVFRKIYAEHLFLNQNFLKNLTGTQGLSIDEISAQRMIQSFVSYLILQQDIQIFDVNMGSFYQLNFYAGRRLEKSVSSKGLQYRWSFESKLLDQQGEVSSLGEISGDPDDVNHVSIHSYFKFSGKNFSGFDAVANMTSPHHYAGQAEFWLNGAINRSINASGSQGRLDSVKSVVSLEPVQEEVKNIHANLSWSRSQAGWELKVQPLSFVVENRPPIQNNFIELQALSCPAGKSSAASNQGKSALETGTCYHFFGQSLDLSALSYLSALVPPNLLPKVWRTINAASPSGQVSELSFSGVSTLGKLKDYILKANFSDLSMKGSSDLPGFSGVSGSLNSNAQSGQLEVTGNAFILDFPRLFSAPWMPMDFSSSWSWTLDQLGKDTNLSIALESFRAKTVMDKNSDVAGSSHNDDKNGQTTEQNLQNPKNPKTPFLELEAEGQFMLPKMQMSLAHMSLLVGLTGEHLTQSAVNPYLPEGVIHSNLYRWLTHSIVSVPEVKNTFLFSGNFRDFPFSASQGVMEDIASIKDGSLIPWPLWPAFDHVNGGLFFNGPFFSSDVTDAVTLKNSVGPIHLEIPDSSPGKPSIFVIDGRSNVSGENLIEYVISSPLIHDLPFVSRMAMEGNIGLDLHLLFHLGHPHPASTSGLSKSKGESSENSEDQADEADEVKGTLTFDNNRLRLHALPFWMTKLSGKINFHGFELSSPQPLKGELFGKPWMMDFFPNQIHMNGDVDFLKLAETFKNPVLGRISGVAPVTISVDMRKALRIVFQSYLRSVQLDLPPPFNKPKGKAFPVLFTLNQWADSKASIDAHTEDVVETPVAPFLYGYFSLGNVLSGVYQGGGDFLNVHGEFGSENLVKQWNNLLTSSLEKASLQTLIPSPFKQNIFLEGSIPELDVGEWLSLVSKAFNDEKKPVLQKSSTDKNQNKNKNLNQNISKTLPIDWEGVPEIQSNIDVKSMKFFSETYQEINWKIEVGNHDPLMSFNGKGLDGVVIFGSPIQAKFDVLSLRHHPQESHAWNPSAEFVSPLIIQENSKKLLSPDLLGKIPPVWFQVDHLYWNDQEKGAIAFDLFPVKSGIELENGHWNLSSVQINFSGQYLADGKTPVLNTSIEAKGTDFGEGLSQLGLPGILNKTKGSVVFNGGWRGALDAPDLSTLSGVMGLELSEGTILNIDSPVISRLLGLFSIESLAKHLSLNFSDLRQKGFIFSQISGAYTIEKGVANTANLLITGPNLRVNLSGDIDLVNKTMDQTVVALPNIDGGVALAAGLVGGPVVGVAAWAADKILMNTVLKDRGIVYKLKGPWGKETT
jgi:uncharacterized protein YhdP